MKEENSIVSKKGSFKEEISGEPSFVAEVKTRNSRPPTVKPSEDFTSFGQITTHPDEIPLELEIAVSSIPLELGNSPA